MEPKTTPTATSADDFQSKLVAPTIFGALILFCFSVVYMAYGDKYFGFFSTLYYELLVILTSIIVLFMYFATGILLRKTRYATHSKQAVKNLFAILLLVPFIIVTMASLLVYKKQAIDTKVTQMEVAAARVDPSQRALDDAIQACKYAKMKGYMQSGYSLLKADQAAYSDCATSVGGPIEPSMAADARVSPTGSMSRQYGYGTLQNATVQEWVAGSASDRIATSASFVRAVARTNDEADLQLRATELNACIMESATGSPPLSLLVKDVAAACMVLLGYK